MKKYIHIGKGGNKFHLIGEKIIDIGEDYEFIARKDAIKLYGILIQSLPLRTIIELKQLFIQQRF